MKRLHKIALSVVAVLVAVMISGCGDDGKSPLIEVEDRGVMWVTSRDDETIIKKMTIKGRNGKCDENWGSGNGFGTGPHLKYNEKILYDTYRRINLWGCPPKNGKYEVELDTNFGTYYYEVGITRK